MKKTILILILTITFTSQSCEKPNDIHRQESLIEKVDNKPQAINQKENNESENSEHSSKNSLKTDINKESNKNTLQQPQKESIGLGSINIFIYVFIVLFVLVILLLSFLVLQTKQLEDTIKDFKKRSKNNCSKIDFKVIEEKYYNPLSNELQTIKNEQAKTVQLIQNFTIAASKPIKKFKSTAKKTKTIYCESAEQDGVFNTVSENYKQSYSLFKIDYEEGESVGSISFLDTEPFAVSLGITHQDQVLKTICEIKQEGLGAEYIKTTQPGRVQKNSSGLWQVVKKIKLTLGKNG